jgi:hypothetical protein
MSDFYILEGKTPKKVDLTTWAKWFEAGDDNRRVASTMKDGVHVSTVFLGLDHSIPAVNSEPVLYETMIFGGRHSDYQERCSTWEQAEAMHKRACDKAFAAC